MKRLLILIVVSLLSVACTESSNPEILFEKGEFEKAFQLWQPKAEQGDPVAQNYLGIHYSLGFGVRRDQDKAMEWFERAAKNGMADAQYNYASMLEDNKSIEKNYIQAYKWFYIADANGNKNASKRMQNLYDERKLFRNQVRYATELAKTYIDNNN